MAAMIDSEHNQMVAALCKPGSDIVDNMTPDDAALLHMAIGICGEAGELLDAVKKAVIYRKPLDRANVIEELGDLEFYLAGLRRCVSVGREAVLIANVRKLSARYSSGTYSDHHAQARADKQEQETQT